MGRSRRLIPWLLLALVASGLAFLPHPSVSKGEALASENELQVSQMFVAGYGGILSSVAWTDAIFEYANVMFEEKRPGNLRMKFQRVIDLDTLWSHPILVAAWALPGVGGLTESDAIPFLQYGAEHFPENWKFRVTWAQYVMSSPKLDPLLAKDSAAKILMPLSRMSGEIPEYARNLAFTLLRKNGEPGQAMDLLIQNFQAVPDALVRLSLQRKMADLLWREGVRLGGDSSMFYSGIGAMLASNDTADAMNAKQLLVSLSMPNSRSEFIAEAHGIAREYSRFVMSPR